MSESGSDRRRRKKERTRHQIHQAAMGLFAERSFEAVSLEQICQAADVARGTFFLHFPSKRALLEELDRQLADELAADRAEPRGSALVEYRTLLDRLCRFWPTRGDLRPELLAAALRAGLAGPGGGLRDAACAIVRRGQERGELREPPSPRLAASLLLSGAATLLEDARGGAVPAPLRQELLQALLHGLLPGKPRLKWSPQVARGATPGRDV